MTHAQVQELYSNPNNAVSIERAGKDNAWQTFHSKMATCDADAGVHVSVFLEKVRKIINKDEKFEIFKKLLSFPLKSQNVISSASDKLNGIFQAQDRTIEIQFNEDDGKNLADFNDYLEKLNFRQLIEQFIFTKAKQAVNTIAVVDLEAEPVNGTEPYVYLLDVGKCKDLGVDRNGNITYLMYEVGEDESKDLVYIDSTHYRVYGIDKQSLTIKVESKHGLDYCPASFIWSDLIDPSNPIRRFNSITEALTGLDNLVMSDIFSQHQDLYAAFVMMWRYMDDCSYSDIDGNECQDGFINLSDGSVSECPSCKKAHGLVGPGTVYTLNTPSDKEDPLINNPAGFITPDRTLLDYNREKVNAIAKEIELNLTGIEPINTSESINEDQVRSQYENRQSVLLYWAENFQRIEKFLLDTIARLRYNEVYLGSTVYYGTDFFLIDQNTAVAEYQEAKDAGLPQYIVGYKRKVVQQLLTRMSPSMQNRIEILEQLEPYIDFPLSELDPKSDAYELKANFMGYIDRFEREEAPLTIFGVKMKFSERIKKIKEKLNEYVKETKSTDRANDGEPGQRESVPVSEELESEGDGSNPPAVRKD